MWSSYLTYPQHVQTRTCRLLDALEGLVPIPSGDRYSAMASWLDDAVDAGLITRAERTSVRHELAELM